ncbi:unnamed protein product [Schistosoma curassoni]|uniref:Ovule protein n=1 Tax=Schistosoma curassoni TaxID=6186 RepID=A0A183JHN2_9TREM|nr:unnamed protein product [Schistosoma curassoni]
MSCFPYGHRGNASSQFERSEVTQVCFSFIGYNRPYEYISTCVEMSSQCLLSNFSAFLHSKCFFDNS